MHRCKRTGTNLIQISHLSIAIIWGQCRPNLWPTHSIVLIFYASSNTFIDACCSPNQSSIMLPETNLTTKGGSRFPVNVPIIFVSYEVEDAKLYLYKLGWLLLILFHFMMCSKGNLHIAWLSLSLTDWTLLGVSFCAPFLLMHHNKHCLKTTDSYIFCCLLAKLT